MDKINAALALLAKEPSDDHSIFDRLTMVLSAGLAPQLVCAIGLLEEELQVRTLAIARNGNKAQNIQYSLAGTPCGEVYQRGDGEPFQIFEDNVASRFPEDSALMEIGARSYRAEVLFDREGKRLGHIFVIGAEPAINCEKGNAFFRIVAQRCGAELRRMLAERELKESQARFRDWARAASDWFWEQDENLRFTYVSVEDGFERRDYAPAYYGKTRREALTSGVTEEELDAHEKLLEARKPFVDFRYTIAWNSGTRKRHLSSSGVPVFDEKGVFKGYRGAVKDITDILDAQLEAQRERDRAKQANKAKSEFLAQMSHEIRTPLNGVLGMANILHGSDLNNVQRAQVETIQRSGQALLSILNDILDLSKIEADRLDIETLDVSLEALLQDVAQLWKSQITAKGLAWHCDDGANLPAPVIRSDPGRIRQVLFNFVSNAIKFTEAGEIDLSVSQQVLDNGQVETLFKLRDTGIGMAPQSVERLFDSFTQGDSTITRRFGGTGLGLAISKSLATLLGGEIGVESTLGKGSTFWFTIVCPKSSSKIPHAETRNEAVPKPASKVSGQEAVESRKLRILVAEDNLINQKVTALSLEMDGHVVDVVSNGLDAISAVMKTTYNIVLMDVQMPDMDGITATQRIRSLPDPVGSVPIVALTANVMKGDREKYLAAGMNEFVPKPVDKAALDQVIAELAEMAMETRETQPDLQQSERPAPAKDVG